MSTIMNIASPLKNKRTIKLNYALGLSAFGHLVAFYFLSQWAIDLRIENAKQQPLRITEVIIENMINPLKIPDTPEPLAKADPVNLTEPPKVSAVSRGNTPAPQKSSDSSKPVETRSTTKQHPEPDIDAVNTSTPPPVPSPSPAMQANEIKSIEPAPVQTVKDREEILPIASSAPIPAIDSREPAIVAQTPVPLAAKTHVMESFYNDVSAAPAPLPAISEIGLKSARLPAPVVPVSHSQIKASGLRVEAKAPHTSTPDYTAKPATMIASAWHPSSTLETFRKIVPRQWSQMPTKPTEEPVVAVTAKNVGSNASSSNRDDASPPVSLPDTKNDSGDSGGQMAQIKAGFLRQIWEKISVARQYPRIARDRGYEGQPVVNFTVGKEGDLLAVFIEQPSRHSLLDQAAIQTVKDAVPFPRIPEQLKSDTMIFKLPITFRLE